MTAVLEFPVTAGVKVARCPTVSDAVPGDNVMATGLSAMDAVAVFVESATLVTVRVTVCGLLIAAGAV